MVQTFTDEEIKKMLTFSKKPTFFLVKDIGKSRTSFQTTFTKQRDYFLLLLLIDTGMRINEVMNLRMEQLSEKEIFIENAKGKKDRIIHCSPKIYKEYLKYKRLVSRLFEFNEINPEPYVFLIKERKQYNYILAERVLTKIGNQCHIRDNIRVSLHTFRHYFSQKTSKKSYIYL